MIYFDNAATTYPKPQCVADSISDAVINLGGNPGRSGHKMSFRAAERIYDIRSSFARFFGADPQNVIFCSNCTHALNMAIKGLLSNGDHAVTSRLEHNSVIRPLEALSTSHGVSYDMADVYEDDDSTLFAFESKMNSKTKAVIVTFASNVTGKVLPIKRLGQICKQRGITLIVDAAQAAGIVPINLQEYGIDILCAAGHKSLYGITGTGLMVLANDNIHLKTIMEGGTGSVSVDLKQPDFPPDRYESGTVNTVGIASLGAGLEFIYSAGMDAIYEHELSLCSTFYNLIIGDDRIIVYSEFPKKGRQMPVISFNIRGINSTNSVKLLSERGFALRGGLHCSPVTHEYLGTKNTGAIRFSPGVFNTENEVLALVDEVKKIASRAKMA